MSGGDNLHVPPGENGTLLFDASAGVTELAGYSVGAFAAPGVASVAVAHTSARHSGHHATRAHGHHTAHHAKTHHGKLRLAGEHQPF